MGGIGSGRNWYYGAKETTDYYHELDVRRWQRDELLIPGRAFGWQWTRNGETIASIQVRVETDQVILTYRHQSGGRDWKDESYPIRLDWTACNFGGRRPWFICPAIGCGQRVAILYGGGIFACRHCYQLAYPSQRETSDHRAIRRADRIRQRLGWEPGILRGNGSKPKGMHNHTFERLTAKHEAFVSESLTRMARQAKILQRKLDGFETRLLNKD